ncbi:hypothetical protein [Candidatus Nitrososphaera sp. FF02]|uniref:hypothetical protein n=1 Tax=Candidatus Nitrososphaera sp. FF02 TaxID=3398226 RepID=UPI0039EA84C2
MIAKQAIVLAFTLGILTTAGAAVPAFAHAHTSLFVEDGPVAGKEIEVVLGHTNEPTYGVRPGIHDGKHGLEVSLSDAATSLPLTGATLKADKYYFRDIASFEAADSPEDADAVENGITVGAVFGEAGQYMTRQVQQPGIYGYRLYGNVSYFGVATVPIDTTVFCRSADGDTGKFNSEGWGGSFGCTANIDDSRFPERGAVKRVSAQPEQQTSTVVQDNASLLLGIPIAAVAGVLGWRSLRKKGPA